MCFAPQRRALFRHLNLQKWREHVVFCTFRLRNVLVPQRRALFQHRNFQKWSEPGLFCTFWLGNVLRATTACTFFNISTSKSGPNPSVFNTFYFQCALRHNGVQLFISRLPRCLRTRRLASLLSTLRSHKTTKKQCSRLSYLFAHLHLLSSDLFSSDSCPCWLLFISPYCRKFDFQTSFDQLMSTIDVSILKYYHQLMSTPD